MFTVWLVCSSTRCLNDSGWRKKDCIESRKETRADDGCYINARAETTWRRSRHPICKAKQKRVGKDFEETFANGEEHLQRDAGTQQPILIGSVDFDSAKVDSNVLVGFVLQKQKQGVFYVAKALSQVHYDVEYLRKSTKVHNKFILPNVQDIASVGRSQIQAVLPKPVCKGTILH